MANDFGITPEGFNLKRLPDIKADLDERINIALNNQSALLPDSPEGQLSGLFSIIYSRLWEELLRAYSAFNPINVIDQDLDNLMLFTGITRLVAKPSTVMLTLTGVTGTTIPIGSIVSNSVSSAQFLTDFDVTIPASGTVDVPAHSRVNGIVVAGIGDLTIIETPINGWVSAINNIAAVVGRLLETDAEARVRRARSLSLSGQSSLGSIFAAVGAISGVTHVTVEENVTDDIQPITGLTPHSFSVVVRGGEDQVIADAIWNKKPVGIFSFGDVPVEIIDIQGDTHTINFQRPINIDIWVRANITFFTAIVPDDASELMAQAIIDYAEGRLIPGAGFSVGQDIIQSRLYTPLNLTLQGHVVNSLEISIDNFSWTIATLPIEFNEVGIFDLTRIDIQVG